ncbi:MAG: ABC transporter ATP-binding protein [Deltaproteobacteria bacterium]|nr:ABC transporter ATP-binding protein [Deltaproteobacteria bacterium]MBW1932399.1 ABC transporter ATP-binding protein [Deltaproteobacteria bacterium]MBW1938530.1 ABC transporter ATP-binding protein [Deltaproteobacteria bacterium]MBW1964858.1 ABC transporter ATP-binding protein [Deltaproteobacteria bacterium]
MSDNILLSVKGLEIEIRTNKGPVFPVRDLSFSIKKGESVCLVGESGCGKSVTALSLPGLLPNPPFKIRSGKIVFEGTDLMDLTPGQLCSIRGKKMAMIFQEPMTALNPVFTIGDQISEAITTHVKLPKKQVRELIIELLKQVGMPAPEERITTYPHQLSGGLRQRAMIAMSLACQPKFLIADEPTTALDVTIQAQILELLNRLREQHNLSLLLITHNLGVVAQIAHRVLIMYAGKIVEEALMGDLFDNPLHPYTQGLLDSVPYGIPADSKRLTSIPGNVPALNAIPSGCAFQDRCPKAMDICRKIEPEDLRLENNRRVSCHLFK